MARETGRLPSGSPGCTSRPRTRSPRRCARSGRRARREARVRAERPSHLGPAAGAPAALAQVHGRAAQGRVRADGGTARDDRRRRLGDEPLLLLRDVPFGACLRSLTGDAILADQLLQTTGTRTSTSGSGRCSTSRSRSPRRRYRCTEGDLDGLRERRLERRGHHGHRRGDGHVQPHEPDGERARLDAERGVPRLGR